jgi:hypothetical protein
VETCWTEGERDRILAEVADNLWRYVGRHACAVPAAMRLLADLTGLSVESLETLRHLHLLLSEDVIQFIDEALPALLRGLRPVAPPEAVAGRAVVRGRIAWGATVAARARRGGSDRALHVAATPRPQYGTAEARLLVRTLNALDRACTRLSALVSGAQEGWTVLVERVQTAVRWARSHRLLATVHVAEDAAMADLAACRRSPRQAARTLARVYEHYRRLVEHPTLPALVDALRQRVLAPLDDDALYELWALLGAATVFDEAGWTLDVAGLVGQAAVPFTYRAPGGCTVARLRFGHTPAHWRRASRYCTVFDRYGLAGAVRRPDLIVELHRGRRRRHLLVEVKRTCDPQYIADSIYKVLGYLADFEAVFAGQEGPHALLLLWDGPGALPSGQQAPDTLVLATHRDYRAQLRQWLVARNR